MKNNLIIAGVDEVGRGCLAGPVVSAAVILNNKIDLKLINDSKKINFTNRLKIAEFIKENSCYAIGIASVEEIFNINILQAALLSMKRAVDKLKKGLKNYKAIIKGDQKIKCIGAASIVAKAYRDLLMIKLSKKFTHYAWERNFGYGTKAHVDGLKKFGITPHHRKGFKPIHNMLLK